MTVTINGQEREIPEEITISELLDFLNVSSRTVAVELNLEIIEREERSVKKIKHGDKLEILQFVGGG